MSDVNQIRKAQPKRQGRYQNRQTALPIIIGNETGLHAIPGAWPCYRGVFTGHSVLVPNLEDATALFNMGCFGKPSTSKFNTGKPRIFRRRQYKLRENWGSIIKPTECMNVQQESESSAASDSEEESIQDVPILLKHKRVWVENEDSDPHSGDEDYETRCWYNNNTSWDENTPVYKKYPASKSHKKPRLSPNKQQESDDEILILSDSEANITSPSPDILLIEKENKNPNQESNTEDLQILDVSSEKNCEEKYPEENNSEIVIDITSPIKDNTQKGTKISSDKCVKLNFTEDKSTTNTIIEDKVHKNDATGENNENSDFNNQNSDDNIKIISDNRESVKCLPETLGKSHQDATKELTSKLAPSTQADDAMSDSSELDFTLHLSQSDDETSGATEISELASNQDKSTSEVIKKSSESKPETSTLVETSIPTLEQDESTSEMIETPSESKLETSTLAETSIPASKQDESTSEMIETPSESKLETSTLAETSIPASKQDKSTSEIIETPSESKHETIKLVETSNPASKQDESTSEIIEKPPESKSETIKLVETSNPALKQDESTSEIIEKPPESKPETITLSETSNAASKQDESTSEIIEKTPVSKPETITLSETSNAASKQDESTSEIIEKTSVSKPETITLSETSIPASNTNTPEVNNEPENENSKAEPEISAPNEAIKTTISNINVKTTVISKPTSPLDESASSKCENDITPKDVECTSKQVDNLCKKGNTSSEISNPDIKDSEVNENTLEIKKSVCGDPKVENIKIVDNDESGTLNSDSGLKITEKCSSTSNHSNSEPNIKDINTEKIDQLYSDTKSSENIDIVPSINNLESQNAIKINKKLKELNNEVITSDDKLSSIDNESINKRIVPNNSSENSDCRDVESSINISVTNPELTDITDNSEDNLESPPNEVCNKSSPELTEVYEDLEMNMDDMPITESGDYEAPDTSLYERQVECVVISDCEGEGEDIKHLIDKWSPRFMASTWQGCDESITLGLEETFFLTWALGCLHVTSPQSLLLQMLPPLHLDTDMGQHSTESNLEGEDIIMLDATGQDKEVIPIDLITTTQQSSSSSYGEGSSGGQSQLIDLTSPPKQNSSGEGQSSSTKSPSPQPGPSGMQNLQKLSSHGLINEDNDAVLLIPSMLWALCSRQPNFTSRYVVYHHFRALGWVVTSGLKFGGDFLLYEQGPSYNHASYVVIVNKSSVPLTWHKIMTTNRIAEVTKKGVVMCNVSWPDDEETFESLGQVNIAVRVISRPKLVRDNVAVQVSSDEEQDSEMSD